MTLAETIPTSERGFRGAITAVVAELPVSRYLEERGIAVRDVGMRKVALCPLHAENTPSFTVFEDSSFYCFGCGQYGDVVSLHARLDGHAQQWTAMLDLARRYDIDLPARSEKWRRWQGEKLKIERLAESCRAEVRARRLFKVLILNAPEIQSIEDPALRREEIARCWRAFNSGLREVSR